MAVLSLVLKDPWPEILSLTLTFLETFHSFLYSYTKVGSQLCLTPSLLMFCNQVCYLWPWLGPYVHSFNLTRILWLPQLWSASAWPVLFGLKCILSDTRRGWEDSCQNISNLRCLIPPSAAKAQGETLGHSLSLKSKLSGKIGREPSGMLLWAPKKKGRI